MKGAAFEKGDEIMSQSNLLTTPSIISNCTFLIITRYQMISSIALFLNKILLMWMTCGEKGRRRSSNENMADGSEWTPKDKN